MNINIQPFIEATSLFNKCEQDIKQQIFKALRDTNDIEWKFVDFNHFKINLSEKTDNHIIFKTEHPFHKNKYIDIKIDTNTNTLEL